MAEHDSHKTVEAEHIPSPKKVFVWIPGMPMQETPDEISKRFEDPMPNITPGDVQLILGK